MKNFHVFMFAVLLFVATSLHDVGHVYANVAAAGTVKAAGMSEMAPPEVIPIGNWGGRDDFTRVKYRFVKFGGHIAIQNDTGNLRLLPKKAKDFLVIVDGHVTNAPEIVAMSPWGEKDTITLICYRFVKVCGTTALQNNWGDLELLE